MKGLTRLEMLIAVAEREIPKPLNKPVWTPKSEIALLGIVISLYMRQGVLFSPRHDGDPVGEFWAEVLHIFNYLQSRLGFNPYEGTADALKRKFRKLKRQNSLENHNLFPKWFSMWRLDLNKNYKWLDPDCLRENFRAMTATNESYLGAESLAHTVIITAGTRNTCWTHLEEVVLVGLVVTKLIRHGSLYKGNSNRKAKLWEDMKAKNDAIWTKLVPLGFQRRRQRSIRGLEKHYKSIKDDLKDARARNLEVRRPSIKDLYESFEEVNVNGCLTRNGPFLSLEEQKEVTRILDTMLVTN